MAEHNTKISRLDNVFLNLPKSFEEWKSQVVAAAIRFPLMRLPHEIRSMVLEYALVKPDSIEVCSKLGHKPRQWYCDLLREARLRRNHAFVSRHATRMIEELKGNARTGLSSYLKKNKHLGLTLGLLQVSKHIGDQVTEILYSKNTFRFPLTYGLIALECFLYTIGPKNVEHLRQVEVHVPIWQHGIKLSNLQALWIEGSFEQTKLAKIPTPPRDRLLGALRSCCIALGKAGRLQQLTFILSPEYRKEWTMSNKEATSDMTSKQRRCYETRLATERKVYKDLVVKMPDLKVTLSILPGYEPGDVSNMWTVTAEPTMPKEADLAPAIEKAKAYGWHWKLEAEKRTLFAL